MKKYNKYLRGLALAVSAALALVPDARAMTYTNSNLDAMLTFRKDESNPLDLEVDIGSITNYVALPIGTVTNITGYTASQMVDAFGVSNFANVKFSVTACNRETPPANYPIAGDTLWATRARMNPAVQSAPYARNGDPFLVQAGAKVYAIGNDASIYSGDQAAGPDNTSTAVGILPTLIIYPCEPYLGTGNLDGTYSPSVETTAPSPFTSPAVADLYENVPTGSPDPVNANATTGIVSYIGYFTFNTNGTMTFTRSVAVPTLTITQASGVKTISFAGYPGTHYTLYYTNGTGLTAPRGTWPSLGSTINFTAVGGTVTNFTDSSASSNRFYYVGAH